MASAQTQDAFSAIKCPICLETLVDPRALPCGHSLCGPKTANGCLAKLEDDGEITCPSCRIIHQISADDVPPVYAFREILEAMESEVGELRLCDIHGKKVTFHCRSDGKDGCVKCVKDHAGHELEDPEDLKLRAEEEARRKLTSFWESEDTKLEVKTEACQKRIELLKRIRAYLDDEIRKEDKLETSFRILTYRRSVIPAMLAPANFDQNKNEMQHLKRLQDELTTICECHEMDTQAAQEMSDLMSHLIKNRVSVFCDDIQAHRSQRSESMPSSPKKGKTATATSCSSLMGKNSSLSNFNPKKVTTILALAEYQSFHQTLSAGDNEWCGWEEKDLGENFGAVMVADNIFILGANRENNSESTAAVVIYKKSSKQWVDGPAMNSARQSMATCATCRAVYVFGGMKNSREKARKSVEKLEIDGSGEPTGEWKRVPPMRKRRANCAAVVLGDRWIFITGGLTEKNSVTSSVEIFDIFTRKWHEGPPMNEGRQSHAALAYQGQIYVFSGNNSTDFDSRTNSCERLNPQDNKWVYIAPCQRSRSRCGVSLLDNRIYLIGGFGGLDDGEGGSSYNEVDDYHAVERYNFLTNSWSTGPNLIVPTYGTRCVSW